MSKYYKCEYCGRRILTEVCRYCGGINEFNEMTPAPPKAEKSAPQKKESTKKSSKKRFPRIRLGAAELIIGSVLILVGFLVYILWDAEIVWDKKEITILQIPSHFLSASTRSTKLTSSSIL